MSRLIDANVLIKELKKLPMMGNWGEAIIRKLIDEQPTAYDVDAVVEQLESEMYSEMKKAAFGKHHKQKAKGLEKAIEIVKSDAK